MNGCIGILSGDKLKGFNRIPVEIVEEREHSLLPNISVESQVGIRGIDGLGGVPIERVRVDIRAVWRKGWICTQETGDDSPRRRIGRERSPFRWQRYQHIPVHHTSRFVLSERTGQVSGLRNTAAETASVLVHA